MTDPAAAWTGEFGRSYTQRNTLTAEELDALCLARYGSTRDALNREFLGDLDVRSILEIGCNLGQQLRHLRRMTKARLGGIDLQAAAVATAKQSLPDADLRVGAGTSLPFADLSFDLVFTSAVLIHVPPTDLGHVMDEAYRVAKKWIWGLEYFSEKPVTVTYRGNTGLLWKRDFAQAWKDHFPRLRLVKERRLPYLDEPGLTDTMYLFEKT